jgi:DNA-binding MarR family transcriptional regulator
VAATPLQPLSDKEQRAWRALARAFTILPRTLDTSLVGAGRMSLAEYGVLSNLSEAPGWRLRMSDLAAIRNVTPAGMTRLVDRLVACGLVERCKCVDDGRGAFAVLTEAGFARLEEAYPTHLESVRRHVVDHIEEGDLDTFIEVMEKISRSAEG